MSSFLGNGWLAGAGLESIRSAALDSEKYLDEESPRLLYEGVCNQCVMKGVIPMLKSPCLNCDRASEDKNKCLENCEKLKEYQEMLLKQGIYATM